MPAKARDLQKDAAKLGFRMIRRRAAMPGGSIQTGGPPPFPYTVIAR